MFEALKLSAMAEGIDLSAPVMMNFELSDAEDEVIDALVVETDHPKMLKEGSSVVENLFLGLRLLGLKVVAIRGGSRRQVRAELRRLHGVVFDNVIVVGHGNEDGVVLGSRDPDVAGFDEWGDLLAPFEPESIHFVACWAGTSAAADELFAGIASLVEVWGSPTKAAPVRAAWITALVVNAHAREGRSDPNLLASLVYSAFSFPMSGEFIRRFTREDREGDGDPGVTYAFDGFVSQSLNQVREDWKRRNRRGSR